MPANLVFVGKGLVSGNDDVLAVQEFRFELRFRRPVINNHAQRRGTTKVFLDLVLSYEMPESN